jgi:cardiolipin synthase
VKPFRRWQTKKFEQPYTIHNSTEWIQSGKNYFDRITKFIDSAQVEIHLQTYIFDSDETGMEIMDALIRAAKKNVQVFIIVDAYGSQNLNAVLIKRMVDAGIHFRKYGEIYSRGRFHIGRRMHNKILVVDGVISVTGGINISNHYSSIDGSPPWLDFAVIMKGDIRRRLQYICRRKWTGWYFSYKVTRKLMRSAVRENIPGICPIRVRRNDYLKNKHEIAISYREALRRSTNSILIVGGYFLPGGRSRRLIKKAIDRGVSINVVVSERSDVKILIYARRYLYNWMIRNGIGVYEYRPSNVHGKVIISDERWTSIGSYDLNNLSTYSNIELNVDIRDPLFSSQLSARINHIMDTDCTKVPGENSYKFKSLFEKFSLWLAYRFVKTLFVLSVLLAGTKEKDF